MGQKVIPFIFWGLSEENKFQHGSLWERVNLVDGQIQFRSSPRATPRKKYIFYLYLSWNNWLNLNRKSRSVSFWRDYNTDGPTNVKHVLNQKLHCTIRFKELNSQRHETVQKKISLKTSFKYLTCITKTWCCLHSKASQNSCNNSGPL